MVKRGLFPGDSALDPGVATHVRRRETAAFDKQGFHSEEKERDQDQ